MEGELGNFSKSYSLYIERKLYKTTRTSLCSSKSQSLYRCTAWNFYKSKSLMEDGGGGRSSEFFQIQEAIWRVRVYIGGELGSFSSFRVCIQEENYLRRLTPRFALPSLRAYIYKGGYGCSEFFQNPEPTQGVEVRNVSKTQNLYGRRSEFFPVPGPLYREKTIYDDWHLTLLDASLF